MIAHDTLLLACGTAEGRSALREIFSEEFNLLEADNNQQMMLLLEQNHHCIACVLLDIATSDKLDMSVVEAVQRSERLRTAPIVVITPAADHEMMVRAFEMGAIEAVTADCDPFVLHKRVQNIVDLHRHKWHLETMVQEQASILRHSNDAMVDVLSSLIEYRSVESGQHILRIRRFTEVLLRELQRSCPRYELTDSAISIISSAAALHDIGKISIPDAILNKPGKLTPQEWEVMKSHAVTGSSIVESLGHVANHEYLRYAYNICRYHHERWDGSGYPDGISGDNIPICAQVVGLADAYDALTTRRVYKEAYSYDRAINMILNGECGVFSTRLLECFKRVTGKFAELAQSYADGHSPKAETFNTILPVPDQAEELDALHIMTSKYQMMLHYLNATVVEADLVQKSLHVVYNPDPNLFSVARSASFEDMEKSLLEEAVVPEEKERMYRLLHEGIPQFLSDGLLRAHYQFHVGSRSLGVPVAYDMTILRQNTGNPQNKKLILVWRRAQENETGQAVDHWQTDESIRSLLPARCAWRNDANLTITRYAGDLASLLGYTEGQFMELSGGSMMNLMEPEDRERVRSRIRSQLTRGKTLELEYRLTTKSGEVLWILNKMFLLLDQDGQEYFHGVAMDVSSVKQELFQTQKTLDQHKIILSQTENVLFEWDLKTSDITYSENWTEMFGYDPLPRDLLTNIYTDSHFHPEDIKPLLDKLHAMEDGVDYQVCEVRIAKADGRYLWCRIRATAVREDSGALDKIVGIIINIDEEKRSAQILLDRAERDALTKLLNKNAARQQAETYLSASAQSHRCCALFIIDLDNFKYINDRYGHMFGDAVLAQVAKEIKRLFRAQDIVARIGGDEFLVLMRGIANRNLVSSRCERMVEAFHNILRTQLRGDQLSCSVGVALYPQHGSSYSELFRRADQALYLAKDQGKNGYAIYDGENGPLRDAAKLHTAVNAPIDSDDQTSLSGSNIIRYAFRHLYESGDVETAIEELLAMAGRQMNVSRVYIFENSADNRCCSNTFEWCNDGIASEKEILQDLSYSVSLPNLLGMFNEQGIFYCSDITTLPEDLRDILAVQNVKSILLCALREGGVMRGFMGFDECRVTRLWNKEQINLLTFFSEMLSVFLLKHRTQDANVRRAKDLSTLLDMQETEIYVMDPNDSTLLFMNERARENTSAKVGSVFDTHTLRYAVRKTPVPWDGKKAVMLVCED